MTRFDLGRFVKVLLSLLILKAGGQAGLAKDYVAVIDTSASMKADSKLEYAIAGVETLCALLQPDDTLCVISFNESATIHGPFVMASDRKQLTKITSQLRASGGTDYLQALQKIPRNSTVAVFLSDGAHHGDAKPVLEFVEDEIAGRFALHTIAVGCPIEAAAEKLLSRMAAASDASSSRVDHSEQLVQTFLRLVLQAGEYRAFKPSQVEVTLHGLQGTLLSFAYDGDVALSIPIERRHQISLPGENVSVAVSKLQSGESTVVKLINPASKHSRLGAVYTDGLPSHRLSIQNQQETYSPGTELNLSLRFMVPQTDFPVVTIAGATAQLEFVDAAGNVVAQTDMQAVSGQLGTTMSVPDSVGTYGLRVRSTWPAAGQLFVQTTETTIVVEEPKVVKQPTKVASRPEKSAASPPVKQLFTASKASIQLTASTNSVARFQIEIRPLTDHIGATELTAKYNAFTNASHSAEDIVASINWNPSATIRGAKGVAKLKSSVLAPSKNGVYRSTLAVSGRGQSISIPIELTVK